MRLSLLFEVYPGEAHTCDATEVIGKGGAHVEKLLHPDRASHPNMQKVLCIDVKDLRVVGKG